MTERVNGFTVFIRFTPWHYSLQWRDCEV